MTYASFVSKVEKGKFKWGSTRDIVTFEQQLMYAISMEKNWGETMQRANGVVKSKVVREDRRKYCLDYNKGTCTLQGPHEGILNGVNVTKFHLCKQCLMEDGSERMHPSKDCACK